MNKQINMTIKIDANYDEIRESENVFIRYILFNNILFKRVVDKTTKERGAKHECKKKRCI